MEQKSGFSRQTINHERETLRKEGLINYNTNGKRTTYSPTKEILENAYFRTLVYGKKLFNKLENPNAFLLSSPFFNTHFSLENRTEQLLFEFSLKLGLILTYMLMQVMNSEFIKELTFNQEKYSKEIKKYFINEWLKNIINPMQMLMILRQSIYLLEYEFKVDTRTHYTENYSFHELEKKGFQTLSEAFGRLCPQLYEELENSGSGGSKLSDHTKYWKKSIEQAKCNHDYKLKIKKIPNFLNV